MPLILTQNEVTLNDAHDWDDIEGVQYHYPTKYRNKILEGERFIYYQGIHRANGRRGKAHYFGAGRIGKIWQDPNPERQSGSKKAWFCMIEDYERFMTPVPAKIEGEFIEKGPQNLFRDGVRVTDMSTFDQILSLSGSHERAQPLLTLAPLPDAGNAVLATNLLLSRSTHERSSRTTSRRSRNAKYIGDWAEALILDFVCKEDGSRDHVHRAAIGETPGWDIDYFDNGGNFFRIEVKGTQAAAFQSIDLTANELAAAKRYRSEYYLYLVARCTSDSPTIQIVEDPYLLIEQNEWNMKPMSYRIEF